MSDARRIKHVLRERVLELAHYLYPNGHREGAHWCVGSIEGEPGNSFKICIAGLKAGLWSDFADSGKHWSIFSREGPAFPETRTEGRTET